MLSVLLTFALGHILHAEAVNPRSIRLADNDNHARLGVLKPETLVTARLHLLTSREVVLLLIDLSMIQDRTITGS